VDEVTAAKKNKSNDVPLAMPQEAYLQDYFSDDSSGIDDSDDDNDRCLFESSTVGSRRIDFGSSLRYDVNMLGGHVYNAYEIIIPRAKEIVSIVAASQIAETAVLLLSKLLTR
jgi:hypothetical protein